MNPKIPENSQIIVSVVPGAMAKMLLQFDDGVSCMHHRPLHRRQILQIFFQNFQSCVTYFKASILSPQITKSRHFCVVGEYYKLITKIDPTTIPNRLYFREKFTCGSIEIYKNIIFCQAQLIVLAPNITYLPILEWAVIVVRCFFSELCL